MRNTNTVSFDVDVKNADVESLEIEPKEAIVAPNYDNDAEADADADADAPVDDIDMTDAGCFKRLRYSISSVFIGFLFPKVTPLPVSAFLILSFFAAFPAAAYIFLFTKMGIGLSTFYYLSENYQVYAYYLGLALASGAFILYLLDCYYWASKTGIALRRLFIILFVAGASILTLIMCGDYPYGPIALFIVLTPLWMVLVRAVVYNKIEPRVYVSWLSGPFFLISTLAFFSWLAWTLASDENDWNFITSLAEADESGCEPNFVDYPDCQGDDGNVCWTADLDTNSLTFGDDCSELCTNVYEDCFNSFILWAGPFLVSLGFMFLSFVATFMRPSERRSTAEQDGTKFVKVWVFLLFGMWVGASLAGAGAGVSTTLAALTLSSFIAAAIFLAISYNQIERQEQMGRIGAALVEKYGNHFDVFRGLLIVTCAPVFMLYFGVSFVIQRIRSIKFCDYTKPPVDTKSLRNVTGNGWFTVEARRFIREFQSWNRTKVFVYAVYWGLAFMILNVIVSQFTLVFLSWLIETTSVMPLGTVTAILAGIGMIMFLLPPVPGVPIYLTLGIVIIPVGRDALGGIVWCMLYALGVSLCLKLLACTLQQKMIGGLLEHKVGVRQFCGVNSSLMRSMKLLLRQPGISLDKVSILVGGPDWPTSVLCGIMGLELIPILIGTLPIIFLIAPTMLTGSFTYMASVRLDDGQPEFPWAGTVATIFAAITAMVQFGSMVFAAYYLEQTVTNRQEELEAMPIDEEVKIADDKDAEITAVYEEVTQWNALPHWARFLLGGSLTTMIISCYLVQLFQADCFREYQLTYTIEQNLDGDWKNLLKPLGVVANALFLVSIVLLYVFRKWAMRKAVTNYKSSSTPPHPSPPK